MGGTSTTPRYTIHVGEYSIIEDLNLNELFAFGNFLMKSMIIKGHSISFGKSIVVNRKGAPNEKEPANY